MFSESIGIYTALSKLMPRPQAGRMLTEGYLKCSLKPPRGDMTSLCLRTLLLLSEKHFPLPHLQSHQ